MIVRCRLYGGLGNQAFQIAATIGAAKDNGGSYRIPKQTINPLVWPPRLSHLFRGDEFNDEGFCIYKQPSHGYAEIELSHKLIHRGTILDGYFQSYLFFDKYRSEILDLFKSPQLVGKNGIVSIHKRMGDYSLYPTKHPIISEEYISQAILFFFEKGYNNFLVFSDEIEKCKGEINSSNFPECNFVYSSCAEPLDDLYLMASCEHNIISNSTFGWWGAYLNRNPDKIVITPSEDNWFGIDNKHLDVSDLLPPDWIRIKY